MEFPTWQMGPFGPSLLAYSFAPSPTRLFRPQVLHLVKYLSSGELLRFSYSSLAYDAP